MRLPDFVVIGAAKSGTTSLYALLDRHPGIFMPEIKEPEFFARDDIFAQGIQSYAQAYAQARPEQLVGEASTLYTLSPLYPQTAARLAAHTPDAKLIYMMRQPVERAYSFYVQLIKTYQNSTGDLAVHRSFEECLDPARRAPGGGKEILTGANAHLPDTPELCLAGSDYVVQIEAWLEHFPREQMLFLKFEDFVANRSAVTRQITEFLDLPPLAEDIFDEKGVTRNIAATHFSEMGDRRAIDKLKGSTSGLWGLRRLLPKSLRKRLRGHVASVAATSDNSHVPAKMEAATRDVLTTRYKAQEARLAELTGLSFDDWWR